VKDSDVSVPLMQERDPGDGTTIPALSVRDLSVGVSGRGNGVLPAVDGASFDVAAGKTLCLVGESGCGKSMTCLAALGLLPPLARITSGQILLDGLDICRLNESQMTKVRGARIGIIYQDPTTALNPVMTIGRQIIEALTLHRAQSGKAAEAEALRLLDRVGIADGRARLRDYPHQLSGGMNQRVMIAIAIACRPRLLIADEPTTALDVTIQAQVLDLLRGMQDEFGTAMLLVTHDLGVVADMADDVAVMYAGRVVEHGAVGDVFTSPMHPYTEALLACMPRIDRDERLLSIRGVVPSLANLPTGCHFRQRCDYATEPCAQARPGVYGDRLRRSVACFNPRAAA